MTPMLLDKQFSPAKLHPALLGCVGSTCAYLSRQSRTGTPDTVGAGTFWHLHLPRLASLRSAVTSLQYPCSPPCLRLWSQPSSPSCTNSSVIKEKSSPEDSLLLSSSSLAPVVSGCLQSFGTAHQFLPVLLRGADPGREVQQRGARPRELGVG